MTIEEHKADIWRGIHGLAVETLINNLAQARYSNEQLFAANSNLTKENAALKQPATETKP
jgi:hypothetical protein